MARAVQCPACGQAHPLDTLAGTPTFSCAGCGRTLRTPTELVRPSGATPAVRGASGPVPKVATSKPAQSNPAARVAKPKPKAAASNGASAGASTSSARRDRPRRTGAGKLGLPVRIGAWVVAVGLGLLLTWFVASAFGFISRSQLVDMFRSSTPTNYIRLFLLIPVWAFMSACLATAFIEGTRMFLARRAGGGSSAGDPKEPRPPRPAIATRVPEVERDDRPDPEPARVPLPPGQRTRIRPREPTV
jgi:hypothetical protein